MNAELLGIALDILLVALLGVTIGYAVLLNRRLSALRHNRDEFAALINALNQATKRAESALQRLKSTSEAIGQDLQARVNEGQAVRDDIQFLLERANQRADELAESVRQNRPPPVEPPSPLEPTGRGFGSPEPIEPMSGQPAAGEAPQVDPEPSRHPDERDLLKALQGLR
ncbi:MAG: DUF6468 domain-containing protein [Alphaproteobacteria bacterium]|nr:DUF6468 domain-containing protein [Alphaproteobacteria bacterium]